MAAQIGLGDLPEDELTAKKLAGNQILHGILMDRIKGKTSHLAPYEQVKKIYLLNRELTEDDGELTPTRKVKRNIVSKKFKDELDALYES